MKGPRLTGAMFGFVAFAMLTSMAQAGDGKDIYAPGTRNGPFVTTNRSLTSLVHDHYEIRGNLGTALVLQKGASIYSCVVPPDPEHLSFRTYFVCSELKEKFGDNGHESKQTLPELKMKQPALEMAQPKLEMAQPKLEMTQPQVTPEKP